MRAHKITARHTPKLFRLTPPPFGLKDLTKRKRGGTIFRSPLTGTVLAATKAFHTVETLATPLGMLVTAVDQFNWGEYGGLTYWVNGEMPLVPADQCQCRAGDIISWSGTASLLATHTGACAPGES